MEINLFVTEPFVQSEVWQDYETADMTLAHVYLEIFIQQDVTEMIKLPLLLILFYSHCFNKYITDAMQIYQYY